MMTKAEYTQLTKKANKWSYMLKGDRLWSKEVLFRVNGAGTQKVYNSSNRRG